MYFDLYVILDIFSRKAVHFEVHPTENGDLAKAFLEHAVTVNGGVRPNAVHADRGTSMTSQPVAALLAHLNIDQSHSRPHVSNDCPSQRLPAALPVACRVRAPADAFGHVDLVAVLEMWKRGHAIVGPPQRDVLAPGGEATLALTVDVPDDLVEGVYQLSVIAVVNGTLAIARRMVQVAGAPSGRHPW